MSTGQRSGRSHLFLVRVWSEEAGDGQTEWCGKVQQVVSGEARSFEGREALVEVLEAMLSNDQPQKRQHLEGSLG